MARLLTYLCCKCDYSVLTEPDGHYLLVAGEYDNYICKNCNEIVSIKAEPKDEEGEKLQCPNCLATDSLEKWNPVDGVCPKCGGKMCVDNNAYVVMAD